MMIRMKILRIRILGFTTMRIRILGFATMRIQILIQVNFDSQIKILFLNRLHIIVAELIWVRKWLLA